MDRITSFTIDDVVVEDLKDYEMRQAVNSATSRMAMLATDFQDMHGRALFKRNILPFDAEHADPKKLEEAGYVVDIQKEHKGNCIHYKMRLLKIVDTEQYSIKYSLDMGENNG